MAQYLDELIQKITTKADLRGFNELDSKQTRAEKKNKVLSNSFKVLFGAISAGIVVKGLIDVATKLGSIEANLTAATGSAKLAGVEFNYIVSEASRLGVSIDTAAMSYAKFYAAVGNKMPLNQIHDINNALMETFTVLHTNPAQQQRGYYALFEMMSEGKITARRIRQLALIIPQTFAITEQILGKNYMAQIRKGIGGEDFLPKFFAILHSKMAGGLEKAMNSPQATLNRLKNSVFMLGMAIDKAGFQDTVLLLARDLTKISEVLVKIASSSRFKSFIEGINNALKAMEEHWKLMIGLGIGIWINKIIGYLTLLRLEVLTTGEALVGVNLAIQMLFSGKIVQGMKLLALTAWSTVAPFLAWGLALAGIVELLDTMAGKKTFLGELIKSTGNGAGFQGGSTKDYIETGRLPSRIRGILTPRDTPILKDSGLYNKDGSLKTNQSDTNNNQNNKTSMLAPVFNIYSLDPQAIACAIDNKLNGLLTPAEYAIGTA